MTRIFRTAQLVLSVLRVTLRQASRSKSCTQYASLEFSCLTQKKMSISSDGWRLIYVLRNASHGLMMLSCALASRG